MSASVYTIAIRNISDLESIYGQLTKGIAINSVNLVLNGEQYNASASESNLLLCVVERQH